MVKITALKAGDVVYSVSSERAGNTMVRRQHVIEINVIEVHADEGYAVIKSSGMQMRVGESRINSYRRNRPKNKGLF